MSYDYDPADGSWSCIPRRAKPAAMPEIGDEMDDGTIYAGISPDTHKPMYATPTDAPGTYDVFQARDYAESIGVNGRHDFHVPSKGELNVLWENRNKGKLKGTFNETGLFPGGDYWSSTSNYETGFWIQRFSDGRQYQVYEGHDSSLRCVR